MGNHDAGRAMGIAAAMWWQACNTYVPTKDEALAVLNEICMPHQTCDAEFELTDPKRPGCVHPDYDDYRLPHAPLGRLIAVAFEATPAEIAAFSDVDLLWWEGPVTRFKQYFDFY